MEDLPSLSILEHPGALQRLQAEFSEHRVHDLTRGNTTRRELSHRHCERDSALRQAQADGAASCAVAQSREPAPADVEAAAQLKAGRPAHARVIDRRSALRDEIVDSLAIGLPILGFWISVCAAFLAYGRLTGR